MLLIVFFIRLVLYIGYVLCCSYLHFFQIINANEHLYYLPIATQSYITLRQHINYHFNYKFPNYTGYRPDYNCRNVEQNVSRSTNLTLGTTFHRVYDECKIRSIYNVSGVVTVSETDCTDGWYYHENGQDFDVSRSFVSEVHVTNISI